MNRFLIYLCVMTLALTNAQARLMDRVIAIVNNDVITEVELDLRTDEFKKKLKLNSLSSDDEAILRKQVLDNMVRKHLQLQVAEKYGINIDEVALNRVITKVAEQNNMTLEQFSEAIVAEGLDFTRFRDQTRDELIIKQLQERLIASKINISEAEIEQFIRKHHGADSSNQRYHLAQILIPLPDEATPDEIEETSMRASKIYNELLLGEDFSDSALRHSEGRNALQGGDLGWREASELPDIFLDSISGMKKNSITKPIRSASGFHILKVIDTSQDENRITETHARHILLRHDDELSEEEASTLLGEIREKIARGEDFAVLAKEYSQDPGSKDLGGDLGWAGPGKFVPAFENAMDPLEDGEVSTPFRSQFGWHIVQVIERRKRDISSDLHRLEARKSLHNKKLEEELQLWLRRIRSEAYIEYRDLTKQ